MRCWGLVLVMLCVAGCGGRDKVPGPGGFRPPDADQDAGVDAGDASNGGFAGAYGNMGGPNAGSGGMGMPPDDTDAWAKDLADDDPQEVGNIGLGTLENMFINDSVDYVFLHPLGLLVGNEGEIYLAPRNRQHENWMPPTGEEVMTASLRGNRLVIALFHKGKKTIRVMSLDITRHFLQGSELTITDWPAGTIVNPFSLQLSDDRVVLCLSPDFTDAPANYVVYKLDSGTSIGKSDNTTRWGSLRKIPDRDAFIEYSAAVTLKDGKESLIARYNYITVLPDNTPHQVAFFDTTPEGEVVFDGNPATRLLTITGSVLDISDTVCEGDSASQTDCMKKLDPFSAGNVFLTDSSPKGDVFAVTDPVGTQCKAMRLDVNGRRVVSMSENYNCRGITRPAAIHYDSWSGKILYRWAAKSMASVWLNYQ